MWEVLVKPEFIRQWDDLPDGFDEEELTNGSVIEWAGYSVLTVVTFEPFQQLRQTLYSPQWELPPSAYDIAYTYTLSAKNSEILLKIEIGDFAQLPDGERFYDASVEFADAALQKIKELAEE